MLPTGSVEMRFAKRVKQQRQMQVVSPTTIFACSMGSNITVASGPISVLPSPIHQPVTAGFESTAYVKL